MSALNAKLWVSGGSYVAATAGAPASVVVDPAKPSTTYRCIANVSGRVSGACLRTARRAGSSSS